MVWSGCLNSPKTSTGQRGWMSAPGDISACVLVGSYMRVCVHGSVFVCACMCTWCLRVACVLSI